MKFLIFLCLLVTVAFAAPIEKKDEPVKPLETAVKTEEVAEKKDTAALVKPEESIKGKEFIGYF